MAFFFTVISTAVLFIASNLIVRFSKTPVSWILPTSLLITFLPILLGLFFSTMAFFYTVALLVLVFVRKCGRWRARIFFAMSLLALLGMGTYFSISAWSMIEHYQQLYPLVSLEDRLPALPPRTEPVPLSTAARQHLLEVAEYYNDPDSSWRSRRSTALRDLHENVTLLFVMSPSFGVARMPSPYVFLKAVEPDRRLTRFPEPFFPVSWSLGDIKDRPEPLPSFRFDHILLEPLSKFIPPGSEGYVKSRKEVAGFEPHGQNDYLRPLEERYQAFQVIRLDLVSLLLHESPVAYDSETLPSMEQIKQMKTRPLDAFEQYGLAVLRGGQDLFAREDGKRIRLIGALRNAKMCMKCHGGDHGELLGAFSYTLEKK